jgi:DNA topoisomerase I
VHPIKVMSLADAEPFASAAEAGLRYVSDESPGIRRKRAGRGFAYFAPDGQRIADPGILLRIKQLVIPPAWTDVWICPDPRGHLQVTGRDARGRKVYLYHARWREVRDAAKYERLAAFGGALPRIRARVQQDLAQREIPREKVLAAVVKLLQDTSIRIGNDEYRRKNGSVGLTSMLDEHAHFEGDAVRFEFTRNSKTRKGKSGESGGDFTAKDFRTWNGTLLALRLLRTRDQPTSATAGKRVVSGVIKDVAHELGNTPAVARKAYVHPVVLNAYLEGYLEPEAGAAQTSQSSGLTDEERCVLRLLRAAADDSESSAV